MWKGDAWESPETIAQDVSDHEMCTFGIIVFLFSIRDNQHFTMKKRSNSILWNETDIKHQFHQFVLELFSGLRNSGARRSHWEPPNMSKWIWFHVEGLFQANSETFPHKGDAKWNPKRCQKSINNWSEKKLEMNSNKHAKHVLNLIPSDLRKRIYRRRGLRQSLRSEVRTSTTKIEPLVSKISQA